MEIETQELKEEVIKFITETKVNYTCDETLRCAADIVSFIQRWGGKK